MFFGKFDGPIEICVIILNGGRVVGKAPADRRILTLLFPSSPRPELKLGSPAAGRVAALQ